VNVKKRTLVPLLAFASLTLPFTLILTGCSSSNDLDSSSEQKQEQIKIATFDDPDTMTLDTTEGPVNFGVNDKGEATIPVTSNGEPLVNESTYQPVDDTIQATIGDRVLIPVQTIYVGVMPSNLTVTSTGGVLADLRTDREADTANRDQERSTVYPAGLKADEIVTGFEVKAVKAGSGAYTVSYDDINGDPVEITFTVEVKN
jgi:hypothetical protein